MIFYVIKNKDPMDVTFIIECMNESVMNRFYVLMRAILEPFNAKLDTNAPLFLIRQNMACIKDVNFGIQTENIRSKNEGKKVTLGFYSVNRLTTPAPKTGGRSTKKLFVFHLTNFCESGQDEVFANKFLNPKTFIEIIATLFRVFDTTKVDMTESLLQMWSKQCLSAVFNTLNVLSNIVPSSNKFKGNESSAENAEVTAVKQIESLNDSANPWGEDEKTMTPMATAQSEGNETEDAAAWSSHFSRQIESQNGPGYPIDERLFTQQHVEGVHESIENGVYDTITYRHEEQTLISQIGQYKATGESDDVGCGDNRETVEHGYCQNYESIHPITYDKTKLVHEGIHNQEYHTDFVTDGEENVSSQHNSATNDSNHEEGPGTPVQDESWSTTPMTLQDVIIHCDLPTTDQATEEAEFTGYDDVDLCKYFE
uniref:Putative serine/threonine protein kinase n=1 Tax=Ixodes ricinus TaxID=34613 RepID=A0A0K8R5D5_IXORI